jgi:hypothetical protein
VSHGWQVSTDAIIAAVDKTHGGVYLAADQLGCSAKTILRRARRVQAVADTIAKYRERRSDIAEMKLEGALIAGESWAIQFQLRTQGRDRGYGDKLETENRTIVEWVYGNDETARDVAGATREAEGD